MSLRLNHIDSMRGFAILCMVQVHTAALLPAPVSTNHPLAFISAAIGGMAAPMFVTIYIFSRWLDSKLGANIISEQKNKNDYTQHQADN